LRAFVVGIQVASGRDHYFKSLRGDLASTCRAPRQKRTRKIAEERGVRRRSLSTPPDHAPLGKQVSIMPQETLGNAGTVRERQGCWIATFSRPV
jgi:hypothetical protein